MAHSGLTSGSSDTGWLLLSARLQRILVQRSGRSDLVVRIAPSPPAVATWWGGYRADVAEVLVDGRAVLGPQADPAQVQLVRGEDRARYAPLLGLCCLAAAHAACSTGDLPDGLAAPLASLALALECSRVCRVQVREHPADRGWVRAALPALRCGQEHADAVLALGLASAGVMTDGEVRSVRDAMSERWSQSTVDAVLAQVAGFVDRDDAAVPDVVRTAESVARLLGLVDGDGITDTTSAPGDDRDAEASRTAEGLGDEVRRATEAVAQESRAVALSRASSAPTTHRDHAAAARRATARAVAARTFEATTTLDAMVTRAPDHQLRQRAQHLADDLRRARYRAPDTVRAPMGVPPGRLRLGEAMRRESQLAAGAAPTAKPWRTLRRRDVDQPPLRVGLSWDISGSRAPFHEDMADLAWALAWAMGHSGGALAAVAWNSHALPVVWPGRVPSAVVEPACRGGSSGCAQSLRALDGALDLDDDRGARVVIVTTDLAIGQRRFAEQEVADLSRRGVAVLWVTSEQDPRTPDGATNVVPAGGRDLVAVVSSAICTSLSRS